MRSNILFILMFISSLAAQPSFNAHTITTDADGAYSVFAVDVDGDGDMDVLSASSNDDKIAWYENDGSENFTAHVITTSADGAASIYAVDVDSDDDMDVLSASFFDDKIAWYENISCDSGFIGIEGQCYWVQDIQFLKDLIANSDLNIEPLDLGTQTWTNGRFTYFYIVNADLKGEIPLSLGNLTELTYFYSYGNKFTG